MPTFKRLPQRILARVVHGLARRYVLAPSHPKTRHVHAAGFHLTVHPSVFHPRFFQSSEFLANHIGTLALGNKLVADVGTGSGILALAAARSGAALVLAIDINPASVKSAAENARVAGLAGRVHAVRADLLSCVVPDARFDLIVSNPPFFPVDPVDLADRAWNAGRGFRDIAGLFAQASERLAPNGEFHLVLSSGAPLDGIHGLIARAGFQWEVIRSKRLLFESLLIYRLWPERKGQCDFEEAPLNRTGPNHPDLSEIRPS